MKNGPNQAGVEFHKHPPERGRGGEVRLYCCGGCCCCCCCLHSLGGLIGAAVASRRKQGASGGREIAKEYWSCLILLTILTGLVFTLIDPKVGLLGIIGFLLVLPAIQLACSVVTAIWVTVRGKENLAETSASLRTIGRITIYSFVGAVAGILLMILFFHK